MYRTYKITNTVDDKIYYGSTKLTLSDRMVCHNSEARNGNSKMLSNHIRLVGLPTFSIHLIQDGYPNKLEARKAEQQLIDSHPIRTQLLNSMRAYSWNHYYTRDRAKLLSKKKRYYDKKMLDPVFIQNEKERNKIRMREKRAFSREALQLMSIQI